MIVVNQGSKGSKQSHPPPLSALLDSSTLTSTQRSEETAEQKRARLAARVSSTAFNNIHTAELPNQDTLKYGHNILSHVTAILMSLEHHLQLLLQCTSTCSVCLFDLLSYTQACCTLYTLCNWHEVLRQFDREQSFAALNFGSQATRTLWLCTLVFVVGKEVPAIWVWSWLQDSGPGCCKCGWWWGRLWRLPSKLLNKSPLNNLSFPTFVPPLSFLYLSYFVPLVMTRSFSTVVLYQRRLNYRSIDTLIKYTKLLCTNWCMYVYLWSVSILVFLKWGHQYPEYICIQSLKSGYHTNQTHSIPQVSGLDGSD